MFSRHQALITGLVLLLGLSAAACATAPPQSTTMRLGALTLAPEGYVDFCRRMPRECVGEELDAESARQVVEAAAVHSPDFYRRYWTLTFGLSGLPGDGVTASTGPAERVGAPAAIEPEAVEPSAVVAAPEAADAAVDAIALAPAPQAVVKVDAAFWTTLSKVNTRINRAIERGSDEAGYGVVEFWSLPLLEGVKTGDCEDYVLEKRRALIAEGVDPAALSIAAVETRTGEGHAVLVVSTDKGDYVLDNLTPWVMPWAQTNYRWKARQTSASLFEWATVAAS